MYIFCHLLFVLFFCKDYAFMRCAEGERGGNNRRINSLSLERVMLSPVASSLSGILCTMLRVFLSITSPMAPFHHVKRCQMHVGFCCVLSYLYQKNRMCRTRGTLELDTRIFVPIYFPTKIILAFFMEDDERDLPEPLSSALIVCEIHEIKFCQFVESLK
mmetsp:Transcript_26282/g.52373  ORF Transcript_26282/g.52373 Transcript_26282/m.52373 type:complete len:160 (+) Transcript_26282:213-692(+)